MKHLTFAAVSVLLMSLPAIAKAQSRPTKPQISVAKFVDETSMSHCAETPGARNNADAWMRAYFINQLMGLNRLEIQEREVRPMRPQHSITTTINRWEVCQNGNGQEVNIELTVKMVSNNGIVRTFNSQAMASHSEMNIAPKVAVRSAIGEIVRRIDEAVPRYRPNRLPIKRGPRQFVADNGSNNSMLVQLIPKKR